MSSSAVPNTGEVLGNRHETTRNDDSLVARKTKKFSLSAILVTREVEERREKINFKKEPGAARSQPEIITAPAPAKKVQNNFGSGSRLQLWLRIPALF
jgi:hypothetical protein